MIKENFKNKVESYSDIDFQGYRFTKISSGKDRYKSLVLRRSIYVDEYAWAKGQNAIEIDEFDTFSTHFSIKDRAGDTVATIRSTDHDFDWMATNCYENAFSTQAEAIKNPGIVEVSRLCIKSDYRNKFIDQNISALDLLLSGVLAHHYKENKKGFVIITHSSMFALLKRRGMEIKKLSNTKTMDDGCKITIMYIDIEKSWRNFFPLNTIMEKSIEAAAYGT
ncbi:GNAT family N-acyltransferase [Bacterioplanoides sp.]|uniref:GNAT family N-acyltransferase n=1 Tax=Bacterioplanoides sp. TaxID=2066072 RepID=UPI003B5AE1C8